MFNVTILQPPHGNDRADRCARLLLLWFVLVLVIIVVYLFTSFVWATALTFVLVFFFTWFSCQYFAAVPEENHSVIVLPNLVPTSAENTGMSPSEIDALPTFDYQTSVRDGNDRNSVMQCAVCISSIQAGEMVRQLPFCKHLFHVQCIDGWLKAHPTCPVCRDDVKIGGNQGIPRLPPV